MLGHGPAELWPACSKRANGRVKIEAPLIYLEDLESLNLASPKAFAFAAITACRVGMSVRPSPLYACVCAGVTGVVVVLMSRIGAAGEDADRDRRRAAAAWPPFLHISRRHAAWRAALPYSSSRAGRRSASAVNTRSRERSHLGAAYLQRAANSQSSEGRGRLPASQLTAARVITAL